MTLGVTPRRGAVRLPTAATGSSASRGYLPGLDGLRALSVVAVLLYHAGMPWLPGGFFGVEVFLVISGYLITLLLTDEIHRRGRVDLRSFWVRRARRLLPALGLLLAVVSTIVVIGYREDTARLPGQVWSALGYVTNWYFIASEQSYFAALERPPVFQHLWSLAIEEQFYLLWPLALLGLTRLFHGDRRRMAVVLVGAALASTLWMAVLFDPVGDPSRVYYGTDTRASGLLLGAALAMVWRPHPGWTGHDPRVRQGVEALGLGGVVALALVALSVQDWDPFVYRGGFLVVSLASLAAIAGAVHPSSLMTRYVLGRGPMRWIGTRSYSLYLWHWPIFVWTRPEIDQPLGLYPTLVMRLVLTVAAAELSFRYVETPIRHGGLARWRARLGRRAGRDRYGPPAIIGGAAVLLLTVVTTTGPGSATTGEDQLMAMGGDVDPAIDEGLAAASSATATAAVTTAVNAPLDTATTPASVTDGAAAVGGSSPNGAPTTTAAPTTTTAPTTTAAPTTTVPAGPDVTVLGDSVLLGMKGGFTEAMNAAGLDVDYQAKAARTIDQARQVLEWNDKPVAPLVIVGLGHNSLWERERRNFDRWSGEFDDGADALLATLRDYGAERIIWVTLREPDADIIPAAGQSQYRQYLWYFPYVNERLRALPGRHRDVALADWTAVSNVSGLTYDAMHLTTSGAELMIQTIRAAAGI
ncbi:MAG: acyltransferase family protein [Desertimonas sp.]